MNFNDFISNVKPETSKSFHSDFSTNQINAAIARLKRNYTSPENYKDKLGRKWRVNLKHLYILTKSFQFMYFKDETTHPLSVWSGTMANNFGYQKSDASAQFLSRLYKDAISIGLIEPVSLKYSFCSPTTIKAKDWENKARSYVCNRIVIKEIQETIEKNKIKIESNQKQDNYTLPEDDTFDFAIKSKTSIKERTDIEIISGLENHYFWKRDFDRIVKELNEKELLSDIERIKFTWKIKRGKKGNVSKIGIRATNSAVSFKEHENENKDYHGTWRKDYLECVLGQDFEHYDVSSSVPNVAHLLETGEWIGKRLYKNIYGDFWKITENDKEKEILLKTMCLKFYFNPTSKSISKALFGNSDYRKTAECEKIINQILANLKNLKIAEVGSEIFLHESCIYLLVRKELANRGIKCCQVYDSFYFRKSEMPTDIANIVKECALKYYQIINGK